MKLRSSQFVTPFLVLFISLFLVDLSFAAQQKLKLAHYLSTNNGIHTEFLEPWAKELESCSGGEVSVTIYPGGTQLGNIAKLYDETRMGVVDIAFGLSGVPSGRFERTRIAEMPFLFNSSEQAVHALWDLYPKYFAEEYPGVKVLALNACNPGQIHTTDKEVKTMEDLAGLKIRTPSTALTSMVSYLGGTPVGLPAGAVYENAQKSVIDGAIFTWDTMDSFKLVEVMNHHLDAKIYSVTFWFAMNQRKYNSLSPKARSCVDNLSGKNLIPKFGPWWDAWDKKGRDLVVEAGHTINTLSDDQRKKWKKALEPMVDEYLKGLEDKGIKNAQEIYQELQKKAQEYSK